MANQAGIELILSAPNVKPQLEAISEGWEGIIEQELRAQKIHEEYIKAANAQMRQMELQNKDLRAIGAELFGDVKKGVDALKEQGKASRYADTEMKALLASMKESALGNDKIRAAVLQLQAAQKLQSDAQSFQSEHGKKGIFSTIQAYFQERKELKNLGDQIGSVNTLLEELDLRQREISLSARRGNTAAIKEYEENERKIKELTKALADLNDKQDSQAAKVESTNKKFSGLSKTFGVIKTAALAAFAAIAVGVTAVVAGVFALGKQNDVVTNQFEKTRKKFFEARQALSDALAPVAFTVGKIFENIADKLLKFFEDNSNEIFLFSAKLAAYIAGAFAFIGTAVTNTITGVKKLSAEATLLGARLKLAFAISRGDAESIGAAIAEIDVAKKSLQDINKEFENSVSPNDAAREAFKKTHDEIIKLGEAYFKVRNLTKEQIEAIRKMREEYDKLTASIAKQIQELNIEDAGPFAGVLLKAEFAAKAIEAEGKRAVELARKLGENSKTINQIRTDVARLAKDVRDDAVKFLNDQANTILDEVNKRLQDLRAQRTGSEETLKFSRDLDKQLKDLQLANSILTPIIQRAKAEIEEARKQGREANKEIVEEGTRAIAKLTETANAFNTLTSLTSLDFFRGQAEQFINDLKTNAEKDLAILKEKGDQLRDNLRGTDPIFTDQIQEFELKIKVNAIDQAVAIEQIRQIEAAFELFKKTGVQGVIQTEAQIRLKVQQDLGGIQGVQPSAESEEPIRPKGSITDKIGEGLAVTAELYKTVFGTINQIVQDSVDAQIEALDLLISKRRQSVEDLEFDLQLEQEFKINGLANDYELLKEQLDKERKLEEEAIEKQTALKEKAGKIQRQQDAIQQGSSLITAVANLFAGFSTVPLIGTILAAVAIAGMFASFVAAKVRASKLARAYKGSRRMGETFGMMASGEGEDDTPGRGDRGLLVVDRKGRLRGKVGGDEFLHKQSVSKKHRTAFEYLNENETKFENVDLLKILKGYDQIQNNNFDLDFIAQKNDRLREKLVVINYGGGGGISKQDLKEAVREGVKEQTAAMIAYHESRPDYIPTSLLEDGYLKVNAKSSQHIKTK